MKYNYIGNGQAVPVKILWMIDIKAVVVGGVIPAQDYQFLYDAGAAAIFGPGTIISDSTIKMLDLLIAARSWSHTK